MEVPHYLPVMLNCSGRRCMIVGGGRVAERKAAALLASSAETIIISPSLTSFLKSCYEKGQLHWRKREYQEGDLNGAFLVYAATNDEQVNGAVVAEAERLGLPVNDAGDGGRGSFITPAVTRRGGLIVAVSTSGAGPAASKRLCEEVDAMFGEHYEAYIDFLSGARVRIKEQVADRSRRQVLFKALAKMDILAQIREGRFRPWSEDELASWIDAYREE
ncbi:precorrin-2 dehydrogenase/sirohydrochlorin ferrochelatase family protein [Paenibacillus ihumii]|uniref:precorrin-2 dehydrogenase/sirohydrochlorin ferrochelatase family protein n=1 Tax=Paenibacillus ihumii TaxID=687436 RepID=UPI000939F8AE|nr:bifunctional precorrin-2 dehydrogenase/sirohydrochlorin ferrochelatase [Paenibacillus ihumii]